MLKLKLQFFGHLMWRTDSLENTLMLGNTEGRRRRDNRGWDCWMESPTWWTWVWASSESLWWMGSFACFSPWDIKETDMTVKLNWINRLFIHISSWMNFTLTMLSEKGKHEWSHSLWLHSYKILPSTNYSIIFQIHKKLHENRAVLRRITKCKNILWE